MVFLMLAVLAEMNFFVFSFRVPVSNHAANRAPEAKPIPIANVLDLLILLINLIFCLIVSLHPKKCFLQIVIFTIQIKKCLEFNIAPTKKIA